MKGILTVVTGLLFLGVPPPATGPPVPVAAGIGAAGRGIPASVSLKAKVRHLLDVSGWADRKLRGLSRSWAWAEADGRVPPGFGLRVLAATDRERVLDMGVDACLPTLTEATVDAALAFFADPAGRAMAGLELAIDDRIDRDLRELNRETAMTVVNALPRSLDLDPGWAGPEIEGNEARALARLRKLAYCQELVRASAVIDADRDGVGEYGTLMELAGVVGARSGLDADGADFSRTGAVVRPRVLHQAMGNVDGEGVARYHGYNFRVYLPDGSSPAGFVREAGPPQTPSLVGGKGRVGVDAAETAWCAYAWPEAAGKTGRRTFFVNQDGIVLWADGAATRWEGENAPAPGSAFLGRGITAAPALNAPGPDGTTWRVAE